jgi:hypothetical protein
MTAILDLQAQPHSSMPYVHIGVIMNLYSRSLLFTDRLAYLKAELSLEDMAFKWDMFVPTF